jgi:DNA-binding transcriptional ArsR family regulator
MSKSEHDIVLIAKALSDKARVKILSEIAVHKNITCNEVTKIAGLSQPTVSHHLKILVDSGLITAVKDGRYSVLTINGNTFVKFNSLVNGIYK